MYDEQESSIRQRIFWWISGTDIEVLEMCPANEKNKFSAIGATILITSIIASLSGGYAAYVMTSSFFFSCIFSVFWGGTIMTIDRLMVSTMRKTEDNNKFTELLSAWVRILLAVLIAFVVSKPAEVKLLENQIDRFITYSSSKEQNVILQGYEDNLQLDKIEADIEEIDKKKLLLKEERENVRNEYDYVRLSDEEKNCIERYNQLTEDIKNLSYERRRIEEFYYAKFNQKNKAYIVDGKITQTPPAVGVVYTETTVNTLNINGVTRVKNIEAAISANYRERRNLGCSEISEAKSEYVEERESSILSEEQRLKRLEAIKDSLLMFRERILDSIRVKNAEILERANSDFFGKVMALEEGKKGNVFFGNVSRQSERPDSIIQRSLSAEEEVIFQDVINLHYNVKLSTISIKQDTISSDTTISTSSTKSVKYYRDPNLVRRELDLIPDFGLGSKNILWWSSTILFLFFLTIELLPIISKIISDYGIYDRLIKEKDNNTFETLKKII